MTTQLPKLPDQGGQESTPALAERFYRFCSEQVNFDLAVPDLELKTITTSGEFPIPVATRSSRVLGVLAVHMFVTADSAQTIAAAGVAWRLAEDQDEPGIIVDDIEGVTCYTGTVGDEITVTLLLLGERE